jgi:hypothetical protein
LPADTTAKLEPSVETSSGTTTFDGRPMVTFEICVRATETTLAPGQASGSVWL